MANIDEQAFNAIKKGDPDKYITGGAMKYSNFEMDMSPQEQDLFLKKNAELFKRLYDTDPNVDRKKLPYKSYLENLDTKLIRMRSDDYDNQPLDEGGEPEQSLYQAARDVATHSERHYGDIDRLRNMALGKGYPLY